MKKALMALTLVFIFVTSGFAADTIKLGGMLPLSGRAADLGITCKQGAELAVKEINGKGGVLGKKFDLMMTDSKAEVPEIVSLSKRYIQKDHVNFLFGVVSSAGALAVGQVAKQEKVIFMDDGGHRPIRSPRKNGTATPSVPARAIPRKPTRWRSMPPRQDPGQVLQHRPRLRVRPDHVGNLQDQDLPR